MSRVFRLLPDSFTAAIIAVVALAVMLPCSGDSARLVGIGSEVAIAVLFFLQGARLSRSAVLGAALHWRLHGIILAATFLVFPLLGLALSPLSGTVLAPPLYVGLLFLCSLPSAVQASVVFTSIAGGNVAAALCSASLSSMTGIVLTPLLVGLLLHVHGEASVNGIGSIAAHLLLPFLAGQILQATIDDWMRLHQKLVKNRRSRFRAPDGVRSDQRRYPVRHVVSPAGIEFARPGAHRRSAVADDVGHHRVCRAPPRSLARG